MTAERSSPEQSVADHAVLLIDDHKLVRAGLRALIDELPGYRVVGEGDDGDQAESLVAARQPDVVVMDISMARVSGVQALTALRRRYPQLPVVMLSMHAGPEMVLAAMRAGATAYVVKEAAEQELAAALDAAIAGDRYLSSSLSGSVLASLREPEAAVQALSPRQREVLRQLALGRSTKEIAYELDLSAKTVETHRAQLMQRLGIRDLAGLVVYALRNHIVDMDEYRR
ncbi:MAG: response regulator transcription factor [Spongiibacteraceae bacterium]